MTKEKMVLKVMVKPKEIPCHDCVKDCMGDEFMRCKKLKAHNKKIISKEYDYDKAVEIMAKVLKEQCWLEDKDSQDVAETALKALLGVDK